MSSVVYAIHQPVRYDRVKREMVPVDLTAAKTFGQLHIVFPGRDRPPPITACADELKAAMARFKPHDRLLIAGDMDLIVFAAVLAAKACGGKLTLLKWDGRERRYHEVSAPNGLLT